MKKAIVLVLALTSLQSFADGPNRPPVGNGPGGRMDFPQCLKEYDRLIRQTSDLQTQLNACLASNRNPGPGPGNSREVEELRRENRRLTESLDRLNNDVRSLTETNSRLNYDNNALVDSNNRLMRENMDLRRQIEDAQAPRGLGFFSYAGCKDYNGNVDLKYIISAEGRVPLEAETNATQNVTKNFSCTYGVKVAATEEIRSRDANIYCVAGCKDYNGNVDNKYIKSALGRNLTEAQFLSMKEVSKNYSCTYGIKIQACQ